LRSGDPRRIRIRKLQDDLKSHIAHWLTECQRKFSIGLALVDEADQAAASSVQNLELEKPSPRGTTAPQELGGPGGGLPGEVTFFTGRDGAMAELRARVTGHDPQGTVVAIHAIDGMAGVGKTAFARHAVQELAGRDPDGVDRQGVGKVV
jgi:hypothetical protein